MYRCNCRVCAGQHGTRGGHRRCVQPGDLRLGAPRQPALRLPTRMSQGNLELQPACFRFPTFDAGSIAVGECLTGDTLRADTAATASSMKYIHGSFCKQLSNWHLQAARSRQGKVEKSLLSFATTYPGWEPGAAAKQMLSGLRNAVAPAGVMRHLVLCWTWPSVAGRGHAACERLQTVSFHSAAVCGPDPAPLHEDAQLSVQALTPLAPAAGRLGRHPGRTTRTPCTWEPRTCQVHSLMKSIAASDCSQARLCDTSM